MAKVQIERVYLDRQTDECPDLSHLGEYSSAPGPDDKTIDRQERGDMGTRELRYFVAAMSGADSGNPESVEQDYRRMEDYNRQGWCMIGIIAKAVVRMPSGLTQTIRSGGLWGVESDSESSYLADVEKEELTGLRAELESIGCTPRQIDAAFAKVERKD
jgi:hypothetical protein